MSETERDRDRERQTERQRQRGERRGRVTEKGKNNDFIKCLPSKY